MLDLLRIVAGLALLLTGAWLTVRSAATLAASYGVSPLIIGATVVAFGTSAPEFVVSLLSATRGSADVAVGNVLGSNIANVGLVLGSMALIAPVSVHARMLRWELPVLLGATLATLALAANGFVGRLEGALLFGGLVAFVAISPRLSAEAAEAVAADASESVREIHTSTRARLNELALLITGIAGLAAGADFGVDGAVGLAGRVGLSEAAIGATIVATGTSLPELATSAVAAARREHEIAVANVIGSNIFNLLGVVGLTSAIAGLAVNQELYRFEMPMLALSTAILLPLIWPRYHIGRYAGALLLAGFVAFIVVALVRGS